MSYDAYATTFSNSRKNLQWPELDHIIEDMQQCGYTSVLDIGCGNGRFLEAWNSDKNSTMGFGGGNLSKNSSIKNIQHKEFSSSDGEQLIDEQSEGGTSFSSPNSFGTFATKSTETGVDLLRYLGLDSSTGMIAEAKKLHPDYAFAVCPMESLGNCETVKLGNYNSILLLASFHHLESQEERIQVLEDMKSLIAPGGAIYMTNWNLRDQPKYEKSRRGDGDFDIKIGEYSRYYHGFTTDELAELFAVTGWHVIENRIFDGGRNIYSKITL